MSKTCTKCSKTVYPLEELKCLDKIWHRTCFKCWECGMTLNMKNYKGFDKKPYCSAHYPKTKATVVAETPELARLAQNTKIQSQVRYHEEFEKNIKGSKIQVADDPESRRLKRLGSLVSDVEYRKTESNGRRLSLTNTLNRDENVSEMDVTQSIAVSRSSVGAGAADRDGGERRRIGSIADYDPINENYGSLTQGYQPRSRGSAYSQSYEWQETVSIPHKTAPPTSVNYEETKQHETERMTDDAAAAVVAEADAVSGIGETEVDAMIDREAESLDDEIHALNGAASQLDEDVSTAATTADDILMGSSGDTEVDAMIDRVADSRDDNDNDDDEIHTQNGPASAPQSDDHVSTAESADINISSHESTSAVALSSDVYDESATAPAGGLVYVALYEYEAQDTDEVSFLEGDRIVDTEAIDDGWMYGRVERTGDFGMLPCNYVEQLDQASG